MTIQTWGSAAAIVAAAVLLGYGVNALGLRCRATAPAVGLALAIIVSYVLLRATGSASTAAITLAILMALAAALLILKGGRPRVPVVALGAGLISATGAAIPFIANGRVGLLGVSLDNDTANHLLWAQELRSASTRQIYGLPDFYPLGPHALAGAVSTGTGARLDLAFTGLLIASVVITSLVAANALRDEAFWKRIVTGVVASLFYLVAAYYAEAAFKEQLLGLFLLALVLQLEDVRRGWVRGLWPRAQVLTPAAILAAGALYVYGYPALAWLGLTIVSWLVLELIFRRKGPGYWVRRLRDLAPASVVAVGIFLVLLAPVVPQNISEYRTFGASPSSTGAITASNLGNLAHALPAVEALGIWNTTDFRLSPGNATLTDVLAGFAVAVLIFGLVVALARRELILPAAVAACAIVYWRATRGQSPYVSAKALTIAGPVVAVTGMRGLLTRIDGVRLPLRLLRFCALVGFVGLALHSSYDALRNEPVWPRESTDELLSLAKVTRGGTVLDLVNTDYAEWIFNDSYVSSIADNTINLAQALPRPNKAFVYGAATDFDSINEQTLDRFEWAVTSNTDYASQPPSAFRLVRRLRMYELWKRVEPVVPRDVIDQTGAPGAILNCRTAAGRDISRQHGVASVMTPPVVVRLSNLGPGTSNAFKMALPAGRWQLSLQYTSAAPVTIFGGDHVWMMPAYLDRPGPWFSVGTFTAPGTPRVFIFYADQPASFTGGSLGALTTGLVATRLPDKRQLIPLSMACGRYVDWYRTAAS